MNEMSKMCLPLSCLKIGFYSSSIRYNRNEIRSVFFKLCFCCHTFMVVRVKTLMNSCLLEKHIGCFKWFDKFISFEKRKKKSVSFSWTIILITAPIVWMKLKKKYWWCPVLFHSSLWKKLDFLLHIFIGKYAWSVLRITDHHCLWVSYLPKYLHTGKTFKYHHFILLFPCGCCIHNQSIY